MLSSKSLRMPLPPEFDRLFGLWCAGIILMQHWDRQRRKFEEN